MSKKFAIPRRGAGKAKLVIRRKAAPVAPASVDHSKVALFGSASAVALAAMLAVGGMMSPVQAAPAGCTETTTGSWFCNNGGGGEQSGDINGNASDNRIEIIGGSYTLGDYPSTNVNAGGGADTIIIKTSPGTGESSIAIDGNISGDAGKDTITIGGGSFTTPPGGLAWTNINGNVDGGDDDDIINITASDEMLTGINKVNGKEGNVRGGAGDDQINITNGSKQGLTIEGSVEGGDGADKITVGASDVGTITIGDKIDGGDGKDTITLTASDKSKVSVGEITGGKDDDTIELTGKDDSEIKVSAIKGDEGNDSITITGSGNSKITIDKNIEGGDGKDTIELTASDKSKIEVAEIKGGKDDDSIELTSADEGSIKITKIDGEDGKDTITLTSTDKSKLEIGEIKGGKDDDTIELTAKDDSEIKVSAIKGDEGNDSITITGSGNSKITIDKNIEGGDGKDTIELTASDKSKIEVAEIKGGKDDDSIELTSEDEGSIKITKIDGEDGKDTITLTSTDKSKLEIGEIKGGKDDDTIELTGKDDSEIKVSAIKGDEGNDSITITGSGNSKITIDKNIEGGDGKDTIELTASDKSKIEVAEIKGGKDDDSIELTSEDEGSIKITKIDGEDGKDTITLTSTDKSKLEIGEIKGGKDDDTIELTAKHDSEIKVKEIKGDEGADTITLTALDDAKITVDKNIDGGDDRDKITLIAEGGSIGLIDLIGGQADDEIKLEATKGGTITLDDLDGGSGEDTIGLKADGEGSKISLDHIYGDTGADDITLTATNGGDITLTESIEAGTGKDTISLSADGGTISLNNIEGGDGNDTITLSATTTKGTLITVDDIRGGDDDDFVVFSGLNNIDPTGNFKITGEVDGDSGYDQLNVVEGSKLSLGDVTDFNVLTVQKNSFLELTQQSLDFGASGSWDGGAFVDATSYLRLSNTEAQFTTGTFELLAAEGEDGYRSIYTGRDAGWLNQTGGVLDVAGDTSDTHNTTIYLDHVDGNEVPRDNPPATFLNNGTIALHNGVDDVVGDRLTISGNYQGSGNLLIDTYLGASNSPTDILVINGDVAPGSTTTIYVNNTNTGEGVFTGSGLGQGIKVVDVAEWGTSPTGTFQLARNSVSGQREVMAGAYSYRLFQDPDNVEPTFVSFAPVPDTGAGDWYLRAGYTAQATGYATAPSAIERHFYAGLDTLHKRLGEVRQQDQLEGRNADLAGPVTKAPAYQPVPAPKFQMWGRGGGSDLSYDVSNGWDFSQQSWGLQAGGDYTFDYDSWRITAGAFGGYGWSDVDVDGDWTSWGGSSSLNIDGWNAGIYASIRQVGLVRGAGFYTDLVGKVDVLDLDIASTSNVTANTNATVWGGSIEMGYGFDLGNSWVIQPQAQLAYVSANQDAYVDSIGTYVTPGDAESLIGRLGLQVQSTFVMATGQTITPYAIFNVNSEFLGDNKTNVAGTILTSDIGGTWYNAGIGFTADLNGSVALFGNGEYNFGDVQGWAGQGGIKVRW